MYGLSNGMIANDIEWSWRSLLLFSIFVMPITQEI